ncbi:histidine ammonia-lyase [Candidatus Nomurabacteria bacterium]|nr:histidine ammonia-lyase [Candidatus Nomurabacteria bacterium]
MNDASKIKEVEIRGENLTIEEVVAVARYGAKVVVPKESIERIEKNWNTLEKMITDGKVMYGTNTGVGAFGNSVLPKEKTIELSYRMVRAHASGVGDPVNEEIARSCILLRMNVFAKGYSGIRPIIMETMCEMLNKGIVPFICEKGSVGTSGDLAPLSQMGLVVFGEGQAFYKGNLYEGKVAMEKAGIKPVKLMYREGLALINGTQFTTSYACFDIYEGERLIRNSEISAAMTIDALNCVELAYDARYHALRPFKGQNDSASNIRLLLEGSEILKQPKQNVQNAYSLRCTPQVVGACRDTLDFAKQQVEIEINSCADNPLYFTEEEICLTGGNFHGEPVGIAMDALGIAMSEIANISERRTNNLLDPVLSGGMPAFLVQGKEEDKGLNSGLMVAQYSQAALVSENKILAHPATVDSIPVSANQEDHVSMGSIAAQKCMQIIKNAQYVIAIEFFAAAQAYEVKKLFNPSKAGRVALNIIRSKVPEITEDREYYRDIEKMKEFVVSYEILYTVDGGIKGLK